MRAARFFLTALAALALLPARAQAPAPALADEEDGGSFSIPGIAVDVAARTPFEARAAGWREAMRRAWPALWARMTGAPPSSAPRLGDAALNEIVSGIDVEREQLSERRYIARLGVIFDRARAGRYLGGSARVIRSSPMLLLPVLSDGGVRTVHERATVWNAAWRRFRESDSPIDYVRPAGTRGDALLLGAYQAYRRDRAWWRVVLGRHGATDVLIAEARLERSYPGGPILARFRALHGPDARELGRFALEAASPAELPALLDGAVRRIDALYTAALRDGRLLAQQDLLVELAPIDPGGALIGYSAVPSAEQVASVSAATPDAASLAMLQSALGATPGISRVTMAEVALGGTSRLIISHSGDAESLRLALDSAGLRLDPGGVLRPRRADEPPLAPPAGPAASDAALGEEAVLDDSAADSPPPPAGPG